MAVSWRLVRWITLGFGILLVSTGLVVGQDSGCNHNPLASRTYYGVHEVLQFECEALVYERVGRSSDRYEYELTYASKVPFIRLIGDDGRRWLALFSDAILLLYDAEEATPFFVGVTGNPAWIETVYFQPEVFGATSFLTEGSRTYVPENLGNPSTRRPWVEGVAGAGIGQEITFTRPTRSIWISIGFVSYNQPELYTYNGRPKEIRIKNQASGLNKIVSLRDTPNPQLIALDEPVQELRIEIDAVYPGERWDDTVVNWLLFY